MIIEQKRAKEFWSGNQGLLDARAAQFDKGVMFWKEHGDMAKTYGITGVDDWEDAKRQELYKVYRNRELAGGTIKDIDAFKQSVNPKIEDDLNNAEKLKDEAKNLLSEYEGKVSKSKDEIKNLIDKAKSEAEKNIIKTNEEFHKIVENRKKTAEEKIRQMKIQALKDVKNLSVNIAISSVEKIIKNSIDKKKLDKVYLSSIEETKKILKNKSI